MFILFHIDLKIKEVFLKSHVSEKTSSYSHTHTHPYIHGIHHSHHTTDIAHTHILKRVSKVVLVVKNSPTNAGDIRDLGSIPGLGRSPGEGGGYPLQNS